MKAMVVLLACLLFFWGNGIAGLDRLPTVHQDEAWIAAPGYTFWTSGRFGSDFFAGYYGMESHYLQFMPLFSLLVGGWLHVAGLGLFQARAVPVLFTLLTLALTYRLGYQVTGDRRGGALAAILLVSWKIAEPQASFPTGIPLADFARIARYDALVPLFALAALSLALAPIQTRPTTNGRRNALEGWRSAGVGFLIGLAALCHVTGAFALPAVVLYQGRRWRRTLWTGAGFGVAMLPWALFAAAHWRDFLGQERIVSNRFDLLNPVFYQQNLAREGERFRPILDALPDTLGANLGLIFAAAGLIALLAQARRERPARLILLVITVVCGLYALVLEPKMYAYLTLVLPFGALAAAKCLTHSWRFRFARPMLAAAVALACAEGTVSLAHTRALAEQTTSYRDFTARIEQRLLPNRRILAMQHYWFGLAEKTGDYRSFLLPFWLSDARMVDEPASFADSVERIAPDYIIIDEILLYFLNDARDPEHPFHAVARQLTDLMGQWTLVARFFDPTYGQVLIFAPNVGGEVVG